MSIDPYQVLGVGKEATAAEISKAYRAKAKAAHPDVGGSQEAFHALTRCHDVLGDKDKRAEYDRTGRMPNEDAAVNDPQRVAYEFLAYLMHSLLVDSFEEPEGQPLDKMLRVAIDQELKGGADRIAKLRKTVKRAQRLLDRFVPKARRDDYEHRRVARTATEEAEAVEKSPFQRILRYEISAAEEKIAAIEEAMEPLKIARNIVAEHGFLRDGKVAEAPQTAPKDMTMNFVDSSKIFGMSNEEVMEILRGFEGMPFASRARGTK